MKSEWQIRREIVDVGRRLYARGLVAASDGNISARLLGERLMVTPSGSCLGELKGADLVCVTMRSPAGRYPLRPTSELEMHLATYEARPAIGAIVHAHPPTATAFSIAGLSMETPVLPEVILTLGTIPTAAYATPGSPEVGSAVRDMIRQHDAVLLDRHGALTVGRDPLDAFRKMEKVEHCAQLLLAAHRLGSPRTLPPEEIAKLTAMRAVPAPEVRGAP
jgi:L-fuculose-phosphate aldolase